MRGDRGFRKCAICCNRNVSQLTRHEMLCSECSFATTYCQWCLSHNPSTEFITQFVCQPCESGTFFVCKAEGCGQKPRLPLQHPSFCAKHYCKNLAQYLSGVYVNLTLCCRCGVASKVPHVTAYNLWPQLSFCATCACIVVSKRVGQYLLVKDIADIVLTFYILPK